MLFQFLTISMPGQSGFEVRFDSLAYLQSKSDVNSYYKCLSRQVKIAADSLKDKNLLDTLSVFLDPDPQVITPAKSYLVRRVAAAFGSKYLRVFSDLSKSEHFYLIAHQHVQDSFLLDDYNWYVENELANLYTRLDNYDKADYFRSLSETSLQHQIRTSADPLKPMRYLSRFYVNLGLLRESQGDMMGAIAAYTLGLHLADSIDFEKGIQGNTSGLARVAVDLDSLEMAAKYMRVSEAALVALSGEPDYLFRLADVQFNKGKYLFKKSGEDHLCLDSTRYLTYYREAIRTLNSHFKRGRHRETAKYYVEYAAALLHADSLQATSQALASALDNVMLWKNCNDELPAKQDMYQENTFIRIFEVYAEYFQRKYAITGDILFLQKSVASLDLAIHVNDIILNMVLADPSKLVAIGNNKRLIHRQLQIIYQLHILQPANDLLLTARDLFTRSKSLLLDDKIRQSEIIASLVDTDRNTLREWQYILKDLHEKQLDESYNKDSLSRIIFLLQEKVDALYKETGKLIPTRSIAGNYIEYEVFEDEIFALARIYNRLHFLKLDTSSALEHLLFRLREFIQTRGLMNDSHVQHDLYTLLIAPFIDTMPERLIIIPDAELNYIPFDLLKDDHDQMLIEQCIISYAYQYQGTVPDSILPKHIFDVFCLSPEYEDSMATIVMAEQDILSPLPFAKAEADAIQQVFGNKAFRSSARTDRQVLDSLHLAGIFHFSGHAIVEKKEAYLALSNKNGEQYKLSTGELSILANGPWLVVLSACDTGLGKLETGEGIRSLGRSFAEAGAEVILFSLWNVYDESSSEIMIHFYRQLVAGYPIDEALRMAKLQYLQDADEIMRHPFYWSGFIATGDMSYYHN